MTELFTDLPIEVKQQHEAIIKFLFSHFNAMEIKNFLTSYLATSSTEEEKNFIHFLTQLQLEQMQNENNND